MLGHPGERLTRFANAARNYCDWVESPPDQTKDIFRARRLLVALHLAAIDLPYEIGEEEAPDALTRDDWKKSVERFAEMPLRFYTEVFNPLNLEDTPVVGDLADDLADIYRDVKEGLILFDAERYGDAAWEWRFNFLIHWGKHLVSAQAAIHAYISENHSYDGSTALKLDT